jgi:acid phosphatase type 7
VGDAIRKDLEPLMLQFGVDLFMYGHVHSYEATWPVCNGTATQHTLVNPSAPVHVLSGAAGPPGDPEDFSAPATFTRR